MNIRYQLLPYIYTLFYLAHNTGSTVSYLFRPKHSSFHLVLGAGDLFRLLQHVFEL